MTGELLCVSGLSVAIPTPRGRLWAVDDVSLTLGHGRTLGLVGESGSGKSMLVRALLGITPPAADVSGSIVFDGTDLRALPAARARAYWGRRLAMVFQDSMTSLNPVVKIGRQIAEGPRRHLGLSRAAARKRTLDLLDRVGISEPRRRAGQYPHELSGGMRQRVAIAMALSCDPDLLIADEATTALDVTIQRQILDLLADLQRERHMAMIIVSHDLGVVARRTDHIAVMYAGRMVETAPTPVLFTHRRHRYTEALLDALPKADHPRHAELRTVRGAPAEPIGRPDACRFAPRCPHAEERCTKERPDLTGTGEHRYACFVPAPLAATAARPSPVTTAEHDAPGPRPAPRDGALLSVEHLTCEYKVRGGTVHAVSDIGFDILPGETLGLVGESGCGKTTTGRAIVGLPGPTGGVVRFDGADVTGAPPAVRRDLRRRVKMIFQDPIASLNPRRKAGRTVAEGLLLRGVPADQARERAEAALRDVGLDPAEHAGKKPFQLSGGQCQRVAIARAMVLEPSLLICDEPVSALDVSIRAQVLNLLTRIRREHGLAMLFISHDLGVVRTVSDRVAVMYLGKIVEIGDAEDVYAAPAHPYTRALIDAIPDPSPERQAAAGPRLEGQLPSPMAPPSGCHFRTRCPLAQDVCAEREPEPRETAPGHAVACHFPLEPVR